MKKIRVLTVIFDCHINGYEIPAFRAAVIEKAGRENILYHNHLSETEFIYRYPLIQYKSIKNKPAIQCIEQGVDEIHKFFENKSWDIEISGRVLKMKIATLKLNQYNMQVWNKKFFYNIHNWIALNNNNYKRYLEINTLSEKKEMLEKTLLANIISMAKGIEWTIEKQIELTIHEIKNTRTVTFKGKKLLAFDIDFSSNVFLPDYIGLGKSVSLGFGTIRHYNNNKKENNE